MNLHGYNMGTPLIGLSLDRRRAHVAQRCGGGEAWIEATLALPAEPWNEAAWPSLAEQLAGVVERRGFAGRRVAVALPLWMHSSVAVQLPPRESGAPLDRIAATQLGEALGVAPEHLMAGWWETPAPANAPRRPSGAPVPVSAIVCGGPCAMLEALGHGLADAGLEPVAILPRSWCLARGVEAERAVSAGVHAAALEAHFHGALLTVFRDHEVVFERALPEHGLEGLVRQMVDKLGVDEDAALLLATEPADAPALEPLRRHAPTGALIASARGLVEGFARGVGAEVATSFDYCGATGGLSVGSLRVVAPSGSLAQAVGRHVCGSGFAGAVEVGPAHAVARGAALAGATRVGLAAQGVSA